MTANMPQAEKANLRQEALGQRKLVIIIKLLNGNRVFVLSITVFLILCFVGCGSVSEQQPLDIRDGNEEIETGTENTSEVESNATGTIQNLPFESQEQSALLDEMKALLKEIPYTSFVDGHYKAQAYPYITDEVGRQLADFIAGIIYFNGISEKVDDVFILRASLHATATLQWFSEEMPFYYPELSSLQLLDLQVSNEIIPKRHIDVTAKRLFGDNVVIQDYSFYGYDFYIEELEAYSIGGYGAPVSNVPIILSYTELLDGYEAVVVFVNHSDHGFVMDGKMDVLSYAQLKDYIETKQKYRIRIGKKSDGDFYYSSHSADAPSATKPISEAQQASSSYMAQVYYDYLISLGGEIETTASSNTGAGVVKHQVGELYYSLGDFNDDGIIDLAISAEEADSNGIELYTYQDGQVTKLLSNRLPYSAGNEIFTLAKLDDTYGIKYLRFNSVGEWSFFHINKDGTLQVVFEEWLYDIDGNKLDTSGTFDKIIPITFWGIEELQKMFY